MGTIIFLSVLTLIGTAIWGVAKYTKIKDTKDLQTSLDKNIEWQLMDGLHDLKIETLAKHSDKSRIASIVSSRISDYLKMGVDPSTLYRVFENLRLNPAVRQNWNEKEVELSALIQQFVLQNEDSHDLMLWNKTVLNDKKQGLQKMQASFLVKVRKDMTVWSPLDN